MENGPINFRKMQKKRHLLCIEVSYHLFLQKKISCLRENKGININLQIISEESKTVTKV